MKKILVLSLFLCLAVCLGACTKRDKLLGDAMLLQIEQVGQTELADIIELSYGSSCKLKAVVRNMKLEEVSEPVSWSVSPSTLGSFSSANSINTEFTSEAVGTGKITLSCQGVVATVNVSVS